MDDVTEKFDWFRDDGIFAPMLNDVARNNFYKSAIDQSVTGKIVADVGAGTGLLTVMSCMAGANHVYAVERHPDRVKYLNEVISRTNLEHKVTVVPQEFLDTNISADIYVSETINTQIFGEDIHRLANHAYKFGGRFIPSHFDIWAEIYVHHPIFVLDQSFSDASEINPDVSVPCEYVNKINEDFQRRHSKSSTLYTANQLNKLFTLLPKFDDIRLEKLWQGQSLRVDLNRPVDVQQLYIRIPTKEVPRPDAHWNLVLFWRAGFDDLIMDCRDVWFGNVTKTINREQRHNNVDIEIWYDDLIRNWRLVF